MTRIVFFGNPINTCYRIVRAIRNCSQYRPELILQDYNSLMDHPAWDEISIRIPFKIFYKDPALAKKFFYETVSKNNWTPPSWIHEKSIHYSFTDRVLTKFLSKDKITINQVKNYIKLLKKYDLVVSDAYGCISANLEKIPYVILPYGSDMTVLPYENSLRGRYVRNVWKNAKNVWAPFQTQHLVEKIPNVSVNFFHISWIFEEERYPIISKKNNSITTFFVNARLDFDGKGTERVIQAFNKLNSKFDVKLQLLSYGPDVQKTMNLIKKFNLEKNIEIISDAISFPIILNYYNNCDSVICGVSNKNFGVAEIEALSLDKPVISNIRQDLPMEKEMPILQSNSENEIFENMKRVCLRDSLPTNGRSMVKKWLGSERFMPIFEKMISKVMTESGN